MHSSKFYILTLYVTLLATIAYKSFQLLSSTEVPSIISSISKIDDQGEDTY